MKISKVFHKKKNFFKKLIVFILAILTILFDFNVECIKNSNFKSTFKKLHENNNLLSKETLKEWPFKEIHRDKYKSDYMGDTNLSFSPFTAFVPLVVPPKKKKTPLDDMPIIWSEGPKKGQFMTEDDFEKPFGSKYSEWKLMNFVQNKEQSSKKLKNKSFKKIKNNLIIHPRTKVKGKK